MSDIIDNFDTVDGNITSTTGVPFQLPMLYKTGSRGKILAWRVGFDGIRLYMHSGELPKFKTQKYEVHYYEVQVRSGADITEQANIDANARWREKIDKHGYSPEQGAKNNLLDKPPMLATVWDPAKDQIKFWPVVAQPKLDGVRVRAKLSDNTITLLSRAGKTIEFFAKLKSDILILANLIKDNYIKLYPDQDHDFLIDGELYSHNNISFEEVNGTSRKQLTPYEREDEIEYHVYDIALGWETAPFDHRYDLLMKCFAHVSPTSLVKLVPTYQMKNKQDIIDFQAYITSQGYEGTIIRPIANGSSDPNRLKYTYYIGTRGQNLFKYKDYLEEEFEVVGATEGGGAEAGAVIWELKTPDGKTFLSRPRGDYKEDNSIRKQLYREYLQNPNKFLGRKYRVRFQKYSNTGIPVSGAGIDFIDDR